jgi:hypothetical protein
MNQADFLRTHPFPTGRPARGVRSGLARALLQPRTVLAGLQLARARRGVEPARAAAGTGAVPVDLGHQPRRILHRPRGRPARTDRAGNTTPAADGPDARPSSWCSSTRTPALMAAQQATLAPCARSWRREHPHPRPRRADRRPTAPIWPTTSCRTSFPMLSPLAIDPAHPFPFIPNTGFCLALQLERAPTGCGATRSCRCRSRSRASSRCPTEGRAHRFLPLEELLLDQLQALFPGLCCAQFTAPSACCAIPTWRSRKRPRIWCANSRSR